MTYFVGRGSADTWDYVRLCVILVWSVCDGSTIGCIIVQMVRFFICFSKVMSSLTGPYSACFFRMSNAYAAWESLCFMYLICSWYLCLRLWLVCPMYDNLLVLHWSIWIPLLSCSCVLLTIFAFVSYCKVLVFLKDIPTSVCLSKLVIFLLTCNMWMLSVFFSFINLFLVGLFVSCWLYLPPHV